MTRFVVAVIALALLAVFATPRPTAQSQPTRMVFVDSQAAIDTHPAGREAHRLQEQAQQEIEDLRRDIESLAQKARAGQQLTPEEAERYSALVTTLEAVQLRWQDEIAAAAEPAVDAVDRAIATMAVASGYTVVLDLVYARQGLVVYAQPEAIVTEQLIAEMERQQAAPD